MARCPDGTWTAELGGSFLDECCECWAWAGDVHPPSCGFSCSSSSRKPDETASWPELYLCLPATTAALSPPLLQ